MKYANIDNDGYILGFYDPEIHEIIPEPNQEIDDDTWTSYLDGNLVKWVENEWVDYEYDPFRLYSIEESQQSKTNEIELYADNLVKNAYNNPTQSQTDIDGKRYKNKVNLRSKDKSNKVSGEVTLTQDEKDQSKTDQKLSEYELKIDNDTDKAISNMLKLNTVDEIKSFDVSAETWNVWTPPL